MARGLAGSSNRFDENIDELEEEEGDEKCSMITVVAAKNNLSPNSRLIECPKTECSKKYRDLDALKYHLSFSHNDLKKSVKSSVDENNGDETIKSPKESATNGVSGVKKVEVTKIEIKEEIKEEGKSQQLDLTIKKESEVKKESAPATEIGQNGHKDVKQGHNMSHGVMQMLSSKHHLPSQHQPHLGYALNGASAHPNYVSSVSSPARFPGHLPQQQTPRTVSPAYSDISDEEPETPAPIGLTTKPVDPKQSLLSVRRDKPVDRTPLDLTQPNFESFSHSVRPSLQQQQQFQHGLPTHLAQSPLRFQPPGLATSTPSLNMLHSLMVSAKFQELQQSMAAGSAISIPGIRSPSQQQQQPPMSLPNVSKSSQYSKPSPLRHDHNHSHLHLGPGGYPGSSPMASSVTSPGSSSIASKMTMAAAEAAKRSMPPVSSGPLQLPIHHLSPFATGTK